MFRKTLSTIAALGLILGALALAEPAAAASPTVTRYAGADRFATSVAVSSNFDPGVAVAYIASGVNFPDALSAGPAAAHENGPLLLTFKDTLPDSVKAELTRLQPQRIVVAGGPATISDGVLTALRRIQPNTDRVAGNDRFATSRALVEDAFGSASTVFLASGAGFPDALSAGAAAGSVGGAVLLVDGTASSLDAPTRSLIQRLGASTLDIAGGPRSVSTGIESDAGSLGATVHRLAGDDRFGTALAIDRAVYAASTPSEVFIASGLNFPDALAGSVLAGVRHAPLVLTRPECAGVNTQQFAVSRSISRYSVLGGTASVSDQAAGLGLCPTQAWASDRFGAFPDTTLSGSGNASYSIPANVRAGLITASAQGSFTVTVDVQGADPEIDAPEGFYGTVGWGLFDDDQNATKLNITADAPWTMTLQSVAAAPEGIAGTHVGSQVFLSSGYGSNGTIQLSASAPVALVVNQLQVAQDGTRDHFLICDAEDGSGFTDRILFEGGYSVLDAYSSGTWTAAYTTAGPTYGACGQTP